MRTACLVAATLVLACAPPPTTSIKVNLKTKHYRLANGLEVVLEVDPHTPQVAVRMRVHAGSKDDPPGKSGLAHLVEHVNFAATHNVPKDQTLSVLGVLGARDLNGETDFDRTDYHETVPSNQLDTALWVQSDQLGFIDPEPKYVDREKLIVEQERRQNYEDVALGNVERFALEAVFPESHPYHATGIGTEGDISAITTDDVKAFRHQYYSPDNATLVVVGDIDIDTTTVAVERWFGAIAPHGETVTRRVPPVVRAGVSKLRVEADVQHEAFVVAWPLPAPTSPGYFESALAFRFICGDLNHHLVDETHRATDVTCNRWSGNGGGVGYLIVESKGHLVADDVIDSVAYVRRQYAAYDLSKSVRRLKMGMLASQIFHVEALGDRTETIQRMLDWYGTPEPQLEIDRIGAIVSSDVRDALGAFFDPDVAAIITVVPTKGAPRGGREVLAR